MGLDTRSLIVMSSAGLVTVLALSLGACSQDPYDGHPGVQGPLPPPPPPPKEEDPKPKPKPPPPGTWGLQVPVEMDFKEGIASTYYIHGTVPNPGVAQLTLTGLPNGATFNAATGALTWLPDFQAANDPNLPQALTRFYTVQVSLASSLDPNSSRGSEVILRVDDVAQPITLNSSLQVTGSEGTPLNQQIQFTDTEFKRGPFDLMLSGFPPGTQLVWGDKTQPSFELRWLPDHAQVKLAAKANYGGHVVLFNPRGKRLEFDVLWTVQDTPVLPIVWGPQDVKGSNDVTFFEMAEDGNGEELPKWSVETAPASGTFDISTQAVASTTRKSSMGLATWRGLKKADLGKTVTVVLKACVRSGAQCSTYPVSVTPTAGSVK